MKIGIVTFQASSQRSLLVIPYGNEGMGGEEKSLDLQREDLKISLTQYKKEVFLIPK